MMLKFYSLKTPLYLCGLVLFLTFGRCYYSKGQSTLPDGINYKLSALTRENKFDEAIELLDSCLLSCLPGSDTRQVLDANLYKADIYRLKGDKRKSEDLLDSMYKVFVYGSASDDPILARFYTIQGTLYMTTGELSKGRYSIEKAIKIYTHLYSKDDTILSSCFNKLGNYYYFKKEFDSAMTWYSKALHLADKKNNSLEDRASYLQNIGIIHLELKEYSAAEKCFQESLDLKETIYSPNSYSLGRLYLNIGRFYQGISALDKAYNYITKAESIYSTKKIPAALELGSIYWNKGLIYHLSGDSESALTYLFNARHIIDSVFTDKERLMASLNADIGNVYRYAGQYDNAIIYYNKSLAGADSLIQHKTFRNLANLYHRVGDLEKAEQYFNILITNLKTNNYANNPDNALTYLQYGFFLLDTGNDSALVYLKKAFELFHANEGFHDREATASLYMIGDYYFRKDMLNEALQYYQQSLIAISTSFNDTSRFQNPALISLSPDIRAINALIRKAECMEKHYKCFNDIEYLNYSVATYELCFELIDQLRLTLKADDSKMFLLDGFYNAYGHAINGYYDLYEITSDEEMLAKAFEISERSKSMILLNELKDVNAKNIGLLPESLTKIEKEVRSGVYMYKNNIREEEKRDMPDENKLLYLRSSLLLLENRYDSLKKYLESNYPEYYRLKYDPSVIAVDDLQDLLDADEVIIEYTIAKDNLFIFVVSDRDFIVKKTPVDKTLAEDIFRLRNNLDFSHVPEYDYQDYMDYQFTAYKLYVQLIQPTEPYLEDKKLIIIPDEELNYLSFESLIQRITPSDTIAFRKLPYLIRNYPVCYASSSTILALIKKGRKPSFGNGVLALAPSTSILTRSMLANHEALALLLKDDLDLPGATWEAETILKIMKGRKLIGEEATEAEFKKQAALFDILHFATHTRIDDENPLSSMLSFYPYGGRGEDGILHTYEIYNLDLKGELAVLSACSTGNGKLQKGEGVISLARAFTYAGMPSVMMTLWDVEDISTGNIVPSFYKLLGMGLDKDDALRQSKLNYLEKTKPEIETHPAFWSGFVLYGNSRGFRQKSDHTYIISLLLLGGLIILFSFVIVRKYISFRKKMKQVDVDLPTEFRPEDGL